MLYTQIPNMIICDVDILICIKQSEMLRKKYIIDNNITDLVYCFEKLEKTIKIDGNFIFPSHGEQVNEFNEYLKVAKIEAKFDKIFIRLERF